MSIVNDYPECYKDTFASLLSKNTYVRMGSSVRRVNYFVSILGLDRVKDDRGRKLLADLKKILVEQVDLHIMFQKQDVAEFKNSTDTFLLLDIREQSKIVKAKRLFGAKTLLIENARMQNVATNEADTNIQTDGYDYIIRNNGTRAEFENEVVGFLKASGNTVNEVNYIWTEEYQYRREMEAERRLGYLKGLAEVFLSPLISNVLRQSGKGVSTVEIADELDMEFDTVDEIIKLSQTLNTQDPEKILDEIGI